MTRWTLGFADPNTLGAVVTVMVCALTGLGVGLKRVTWLGWTVWGVAVVMSLVVLTGSLSRGAWLATVGVCLVLLCWPGPLLRRWLPGVVMAGLALLVVCWPRGVERMGHLAQFGGEAGNRTRLALWRVGCAVVADHPGQGVPRLGVRGAVAALEPAPEHLRVRGRWPLDDVCNDLLLRGVYGGLPLIAWWTVGFGVCIVGGVLAHRAGSGWGLGLTGAATAWLVAGQWSCVWTEETPATLLVGMILALLVAACAVSVTGRGRWLLGASVWGTVLGALLVGVVWLVGHAVSHHAGTPRLVALADATWAVAPRGASLGALVWHAAAGDTDDEIRRDVLAPAARAGWTASVHRPAGPGPVVAVGREQAAAAVLAAPADRRIVLDAPPTVLEQVVNSQVPTLCVYGLPDPRGWSDLALARLPPEQVRLVPFGRLWSNRFSRLLPELGGWMHP
jgi:hypothetical protein